MGDAMQYWRAFVAQVANAPTPWLRVGHILSL